MPDNTKSLDRREDIYTLIMHILIKSWIYSINCYMQRSKKHFSNNHPSSQIARLPRKHHVYCHVIMRLTPLQAVFTSRSRSQMLIRWFPFSRQCSLSIKLCSQSERLSSDRCRWIVSLYKTDHDIRRISFQVSSRTFLRYLKANHCSAHTWLVSVPSDARLFVRPSCLSHHFTSGTQQQPTNLRHARPSWHVKTLWRSPADFLVTYWRQARHVRR